ncbi:MAG TPA: DUF3857 domain-containing protein [Acidobacteriota bacterium]|nr:DUF3857 domain-containing protein [Acidobacteriota bacterium]
MRYLLAFLLAGGLGFAKDLPQWVLDAAHQSAKSEYPVKVAALALLQEESLAVDSGGKRTMRERGVIRILQPSRSKLMAFRSYNTKTGRIRDFRGWMLYPSGREFELPKNRILDIALSENYTYDEGRAKVIECDADPPAGTVFAYEVTEEEDTIFTTYQYSFQEASPVLISRFVLSLPAGWEANGSIINHDAVKPQIDGNTYTWELRDLPWIGDEEFSPDFHALAPRLGLTYYPSAGSMPSLRPLRDWPSVSAWMSGFVDQPAEPTAATRSKSAELTRSAETELDKIRAIARYAQQTNYVSVQMNITRGGGYTPHAADQVLSRNYGDCKDKAALMRALLKSAGIDSYAVAIYSGDRGYVRPEWPSAMQFNHAIVAIKVSPETRSPMVIEHPRLGRLLLFDPTDADTPPGDLDEDEQDSQALVIAGSQGDLIRMPLLPAAANRSERLVDAQLDRQGPLSAHMLTQYYGQSASSIRSVTRDKGLDELKRRLERSFAGRLGGVKLDKVAPKDHVLEGRLDLEVDFGAAKFGQLLQDRLLIIKPGSLVPGPEYSFAGKERRLPVKLTARQRKDAVTLKLPAGFDVDEIPDAVQVESRYGLYRANWKATAEKVVFEQSLEVKDILVPVSEYSRVREFFEKVSSSQASPVVLLRK